MNFVALVATNYLFVARSVSQNTEETSGRKGNNPSKRGYYLVATKKGPSYRPSVAKAEGQGRKEAARSNR